MIVPRSTYRVQFHAGFTFTDALALLPYLDALGIGALYASPIQMPRANSQHGYDICDHNQFNPELGTAADFDALAAALRERSMGLLLDVVPNHMGVNDQRNLWWVDVLENGRSSIYAPFFDIDWDPAAIRLRDKVLLPVLGDQYGVILERGELKLTFEEGAFKLAYWEHSFPIAPGNFDVLLNYRLQELIDSLGSDDPAVQELQSIITAIGYLPSRSETAPERIAERNREKEIIKRRLALLEAGSTPVRETIEATLAHFNGTVGEPRSFDLLDQLIDQQAYRLAFWRVATEEINYRRFFDINDLAAIRVELPEVFSATHQLVFELLHSGKATGLRIDHPDGLWNPAAYFAQLQETYGAGGNGGSRTVPTADNGAYGAEGGGGSRTAPTLYVVVEKILSENEELPADWAVAGTTGYDMLNDLNGIFVESANARRFNKIYADVLAQDNERFGAYADLVNARKKQIMLVSLSSEVNALSNMLDRLSERTRRYRDYTLNSLTFAIREVLAAVPIYRTYISGPEGASEHDANFIRAAVADAKRRNPRTAAAIFDFIGDTLLLKNLYDFAPQEQAEVLHFVMKFQQMSGPVMAKGVEDTLFYVYNRLVSLNEVGGHPEHFGVSVKQFHERNAYRLRCWPQTMTGSSTHDTKRGEDVRAIINVLSEMPREWRSMVSRWSRQNARKKIAGAPSRNDEYLLYQTLIGAWDEEDKGTGGQEDKENPLDTAMPAPKDHPRTPAPTPTFIARITEYMHKATKEAKVHTSWVNPDEAYDNAVRSFVERVLDTKKRNVFLESFVPFQRRVAYFGRFNALSQLLLKLTAPGVPDIYQGCELWNLSLVDPDNRRPVDYAVRQQMLNDLRERSVSAERIALLSELVEQAADGRIKLFATWQLLELRRRQPELFTAGDYQPLTVSGPQTANVVAFSRATAAAQMVAVAPRLVYSLLAGNERPPHGPEVWGDSWLPLAQFPPGTALRNLFSNETLVVGEQEGVAGLPMAEVLAHFPVALLENRE
jgi:(1->4)-alpha-D-glucan 1-alpha-D-glucosylmutase